MGTGPQNGATCRPAEEPQGPQTSLEEGTQAGGKEAPPGTAGEPARRPPQCRTSRLQEGMRKDISVGLERPVSGNLL